MATTSEALQSLFPADVLRNMGDPRRRPVRVCKCHSGDLYGSLRTCPACDHHSYDPDADACERRACGFVKPMEDRRAHA